MNIKKTLIAGLGLSTLLAGSIALAQDKPAAPCEGDGPNTCQQMQSAGPMKGGDKRAHGHKRHHGNMQDLLSQIKVNAADAIAGAEKDSNARAYNLELDMHRGKVVYEIDLFDDKQEHEIRIDAASGEIIARKSEYDDELPRRATLSLADAIATAERELKGKVVDAELEGRSAGMSYEIKLIKEDGSRIHAEISAEDGKILRQMEKPTRKAAADGQERQAPPAGQEAQPSQPAKQ